MVKPRWIKTISSKHKHVWQRGYHPKNKNWLPKMWVIVTEQTPSVKRMFPGDNWEVQAPTRINKETLNGAFRNFKTKTSAMAFAKAYMRKN